MTSPDFGAFAETYAAGRGQVVFRVGVADLETPVAAYLKLARDRHGRGRANTFLLESVEGGAARGRYSIVGCDPDLIWRCRDGVAEVNRNAQSAVDAFVPDAAPALDSLRAILAESRLDVPDGLPPMCGGMVGYLGYDMVRLMERLPARNIDVLGLPDAMLIRPSLFAVFDTVRDALTLAAPVYPRPHVTASDAWAAAHAAIDAALTALAQPLPPQRRAEAVAALPEPSSNLGRDGYMAAVERAKEYIRAGDVFQVVPSQRFSVPFTLPAFALYRALRRTNPAPFLFCLDYGDFAVVGSSPEILVRLRDNEVTIRPLAGTRPRGATHAEDEAYAADLLADPKERAEHLMLLDLGRNDVGRVSEIGSVRVIESFAIERYSHVMHMASDVRGRLRPGLDAVDALIAGFPAGTLSGAPKVRAMEIIEELEPVRRGIYAGCIGYFAADGTMDTCIGLRTAVVRDGTLYFQAGAGIVADSDPASEHAECVQKARAILRAAEEAVRFTNEAGA